MFQSDVSPTTDVAATEILVANQELNISIDAAIHALADVKKSTGLSGRWEVLQAYPFIVADVAHNPAGLREVMEQWKFVNARNKHIVVGFVKDKDVKEALSLFPKDAIYHFCKAAVPRALPATELYDIAKETGIEGTVYNTVSEAVNIVRSTLHEDDALLITGSFFVVGEAIASLAATSAVGETSD